MTGLGILGTFIGLTIGLQQFNTGSASEITNSISPLIQGIKVAFHTSIYGMVFSLIFSFVYKNKLEMLVNGVKTPSLRTLLKKIFSGSFYEEFCKNPAGMKLHHAYLGGLLQHSVDVTELALAMAEAIGNTDKDLITAGALLHDIGKVKEISSGMGFPYTTEGRLLGHITMSVLMVREAAMELKMPAAALQQLEHIILSHHGDQEKGSPMACATKEAFIVHYADEVNSIMNQFDVKESKSAWEYNNMMKRYLMVK